MLVMQPHPLATGLLLYGLTRRLKKYSQYDILYFAVPYIFMQNGLFNVNSKAIVESGYPAHPWIVERRTKLLSDTCYLYPAILKNEIEYLHSKLIQNDPKSDHKIEREFRTGAVTLDSYKGSSKESKGSETADKPKGKRFKFVIDEGQLFLQCIDPFEEVLEIKKDAIQELELMDVLEPTLFDNHKDIINALFQIYFELSNLYLQKCYYDKQ